MKARVIKTDESVIYQGKIHSFGDEFEVNDEIGKSLIERGYIAGVDYTPALPYEDEAVAEPEAEEIADGIEIKDISGMSYPELKAYASELGLSASGRKDELIERINEYFGKLEEADTEGDELPNTDMPE